MISKEQFCKILIKKFERSEGRFPTEHDITSSSCLAVAMEYLGLLKTPMYTQYASERGGTLYAYTDEEKRGMRFLTVRELIDLLPEHVELMTE